MTTIKHLTSAATADGEMPGKTYWTGDTITIPSDIDLTPAAIRVISMTFELDKQTGQMVYTPTLGDLIVPAMALTSQLLRRMTDPSLGGQARPAAGLIIR